MLYEKFYILHSKVLSASQNLPEIAVSTSAKTLS